MAMEGRLRAVGALACAALLLGLAGCASTGAARHANAGQEPPLSAAASLAAGDEAARRGDFQRALVHYLRAVSEKESVDGWLRVAAASDRVGDSERAFQAYLKVVQLAPNNVDARQAVGLAYVARGSAESAREHLARAVELDHDRWRAHNGLGIVADRAGDHRAAIEHYQAALRLNPGSAMLLNNLGYSRYLAGDLEQAALDFYRATELQPDYGPAWSNLGMVYARRGWYGDAVAVLARVLDRAAAHNDIGYIAYRNGDLVRSEELLTEAVRLSPSYYPAASQNLEMVRAALREGSTPGR